MDIRIYKLKYESVELGWADLVEREVVDESKNYNQSTHAVVDLGEGMFDVMIESEEPIDFGENEVIPKSPDHSFSGWEIPEPEINPLNLE